MKNPLNKRYVREFKQDLGKYVVIFLFLVMLISLVSGFLIADNSVRKVYDEGFEKYNMEDGHLTFDKSPNQELLKQIEKDANITFYDLKYFEETLGKDGANVRVYANRKDVDLICLMSGEMPKKNNEIALDRMFARNANLKVGDTITLNKKKLTITGLVALPDYSCLFEQNSDMMFDSINFGVGIMTSAGLDAVGSTHIFYNHAWKYNETVEGEKAEKEESDHLLDVLKKDIKNYDKAIVQKQVDEMKAEAENLQNQLESEMQNVASSINTKTEQATAAAAGNAVASLDMNDMMSLQGIAQEQIPMAAMQLVATKQGISVEELVAREMGTTTAALDDMKIATEQLETMENSDSEDVDLAPIWNVADKVDATGLYNTGNLRGIIDKLEELSNRKIDESEIVSLSDYVPQYSNKAIQFTGEDMGGDKASTLIFDYIIIVVLAFVFAVTTSNTISKEAGVIGTLRASGYSRGEMVRHYLVLPVMVTLIAAVVGNILGYTVFEDVFRDVYYNSYSLATYESWFNMEAFIDTTVIPIILMFVINLWVLSSKMKLGPLQFLRRDLSRRKRKKAIYLNRNIPFLSRFRLRILFQNIPAYLTLALGIFLGGVVIIFGTMFVPLLDDYSALVKKSEIAKYQYVMMNPVETKNSSAEKYCLNSLELSYKNYMTDDITIYGVEKNSSYITKKIPENEVLISNGMAAKYHLSEGDKITLHDPYSDHKYTLKIGGIYQYDAALTVFMNRQDYISSFDEKEDYFTGYFSNEKLTDLKDDDVASVITEKDLTKLADQMRVSMGSFMTIFQGFGVIMFLLLMFILTKQVIEKNMQSIAMTKILGFSTGEIGKLYLVITSFVVIAALLISIPLVDATLRWIFSSMLYTQMTGYIPYIVSKMCYVKMFVMGIISYVVVSALMIVKIRRIPQSEALKNVE